MLKRFGIWYWFLALLPVFAISALKENDYLEFVHYLLFAILLIYFARKSYVVVKEVPRYLKNFYVVTVANILIFVACDQAVANGVDSIVYMLAGATIIPLTACVTSMSSTARKVHCLYQRKFIRRL